MNITRSLAMLICTVNIFGQAAATSNTGLVSTQSYETVGSASSSEDEQTRGLHKIKKLTKKMLLLCLLAAGAEAGGRNRFRRSAINPGQGKFFIPVLQQQTDVHIDNGYGGLPLHKPYGGGGPLGGCHKLLSSAGGYLGNPLVGHPILTAILAGPSPSQSDSSSAADTSQSQPVVEEKHRTHPNNDDARGRRRYKSTFFSRTE